MLEVNVTGLQPDTAYVFTVGYSSRAFQSDLSELKILSTTDSESCNRGNSVSLVFKMQILAASIICLLLSNQNIAVG